MAGAIAGGQRTATLASHPSQHPFQPPPGHVQRRGRCRGLGRVICRSLCQFHTNNAASCRAHAALVMPLVFCFPSSSAPRTA